MQRIPKQYGCICADGKGKIFVTGENDNLKNNSSANLGKNLLENSAGRTLYAV